MSTEMEDKRGGSAEPAAQEFDAAAKSARANGGGPISKKTVVSALMLALVLAAAGVGAFFYMDYAGRWVRTNNAFVDGRIYRVATQIPGTVESFNVPEGVFVNKGALLATLEPNLLSLGVRHVERREDLEEAELLYLQTKILSPAAGYVAHLQAEAGEHVVAGQALLSIVNLDDLWITANFPEDRIRYLRVGQEVEIHVDAYPDKTLSGRVAKIMPAGGSVFSLFPPDATAGNWVRVVQRIPVRIVFDRVGEKDDLLLRIGMLARVRVRKSQDRGDP